MDIRAIHVVSLPLDADKQRGGSPLVGDDVALCSKDVGCPLQRGALDRRRPDAAAVPAVPRRSWGCAVKGVLLNDVRRALSLNQRTLAELLQVSSRTVQRWDAGTSAPTML